MSRLQAAQQRLERSSNGAPLPSANGHAGAPEDNGDGQPDLPDTLTVILEYFRERYKPMFHHGNKIISVDGSEVTMMVACAVADSVLIERIACAADAPMFRGGGINRNSLPGFFRLWGRVAWGDLIRSLPDEDTAALGSDSPTVDTFQRLMREAMLSEITIADTIGVDSTTQIERRSLIDWCDRFAKPGPWRSIRSKRCWCKTKPLPGNELQLMVAIRHELFAQIHADRRLIDMGSNTFTRRCARYGVGKSNRTDRPSGMSAIVLNTEFVADLTRSIPEDHDDEHNETKTD